MPVKKLTAKNVLTLPAPEPGRGAQIDYWDTDSPGFLLRVSARGIRTYCASYRFNGQRRRDKIGHPYDTSLGDAREAAREIRRKVRRGEDPHLEKIAAKNAEAFEDLADAYVHWVTPPEHRDEENRSAPGRPKKSWQKDKRAIERDLKPAWKGRKAATITRADVRQLLDGITERGAPVQANRVHEIIRRMFNWAIRRDLLPADFANPGTGLERNEERRRQRVLSEAELKRVFNAIKAQKEPFRSAWLLRLYTAQRSVEVAQLSWEQIAEEISGAWWTIPPETAKNAAAHRVPLVDEAVDVLLGLADAETLGAALEKMQGPVFANLQTGRPRTDLWREIDDMRAKAKVEDFVGHDLRRTAATRMTGLGIPRLHVRKLLNHADAEVTAVYDVHGYAKEKREAVETFAQYLADVVKPDTNKVVEIGNG